MTMVLPIGPQHPALKEVENFTLEVNGEEIVGVDIRLGYSHRGIERGMQERTYPQGVYLAERVCGICNIAHSATYCLAVEKLAGVEIPERAKIIRTILLELERIHSHLLWAGVAFYEIGFETLFMYTWRDREMVLDVR
ncbi:MAG: nickel-dependent hydrogenase large subunit, partial [Candidatus Hadarchaeales archaeon]